MDRLSVRRFAVPMVCVILLGTLGGCAEGGVPATNLASQSNAAKPQTSLSSTPFQPQAETPQPSPTAMLPPAESPSPSLSGPATGTPTPNNASPLPKYTLNADLDYHAHFLSVDEIIVYPNLSGETLSSLVLEVEANRWSGCFVLETLKADGHPITGYTLNWIRLDLPLAGSLAPGQAVTLTLHYDLQLPGANVDRVFGYNSRQVNLSSWYPFVVPYVPGKGWLIHNPSNVGEHLVYDPANFDVTVHLKDPTLPVTLAASSPCDQEPLGWHCTLEHARTFVLSVSPEYQTTTAHFGNIPVISYYFKGDDQAGEAVLSEVVKALATYSQYFGAYPYPALSIVEAYYYDGEEYDGLFFLSWDFYASYDGTLRNYLVDIAVHETAHQWWFGLVGNDRALEPWLAEALATYSEYLFYQANSPLDTAWWWYFRVDSYKPAGWVDTDIYHADTFRAYANAVYLRGAQFLDALRKRMGDADFFAFLRDYAAQMEGKRASAQDFFRILRQHTSANLSDLTQQYFQNPH